MPRLSKLKVQVVSDVHLDFRPNSKFEELITPVAPLLILAGDICSCETKADIGRLIRFLGWASSAYEHVIYVPGNHEFYSLQRGATTITILLQTLRQIVKGLKNIHLLYNQAVDIKFKNGAKYTVLGTTLWANYSRIPQDDIVYIYKHLNDFLTIKTEDYNKKSGYRFILPSDVTNLHEKAVNFLQKHIAEANHPTIIVTHFKPTPHTNKQTFTPIHRAYEVDVRFLMKPPVVLWAFGHTHIYNDQRVNGVRVYSNPMGYPREQGVNYIKTSIIYI